jgi:hypothetical protein
MATGRQNIRWSQLRYADVISGLAKENPATSLGCQVFFDVPFVTCDAVEGVQIRQPVKP